MDKGGGYEKATFAAGCFWDVEAAFRRVEGVLETVAGYTGGSTQNPCYEDVQRGITGHIEAVGIVFNPMVVSYNELLELFWSIHGPVQVGGTGGYSGPQYRSVIFYHNDKQRAAAIISRDRIRDAFRRSPPLTEILPAAMFWHAEECHQQFYEKCGRSHGTSRQIYE